MTCASPVLLIVLVNAPAVAGLAICPRSSSDAQPGYPTAAVNCAHLFEPPTRPAFIPLPPAPITGASADDTIALVPYGFTKFRVSMFPITERMARALDARERAKP